MAFPHYPHGTPGSGPPADPFAPHQPFIVPGQPFHPHHHQPLPQHPLSHQHPHHPHPHPHPHPQQPMMPHQPHFGYPSPRPQPGMMPHHQQHHPSSPFPHPQGPSYPNTPLPHRPINPMPQHSRLHQLQGQPPHTPSNLSRSTPAASKPSRSVREDPASRKRVRRIIHDGEELSYLQPGPTNRLYLSLKSGIPSQIDWALARLAQHSSTSSREHLTFDNVPGLADALLSYPCRLCAALKGQPSHLWQGPDFEQDDETIDVGIGAPGDLGFQGGANWHHGGQDISHASTLAAHRGKSAKRKLLLLMPPSSDVTRARLGSLVAQGREGAGEQQQQELVLFFDPSHNPAHAALMRRALESALIVRNMTMHSSNARHVIGLRGIQLLIRDVLALPSMVLSQPVAPNVISLASAEGDEWLELEGVSELRLHFLDLLEGLAPKLHVTQRASFSILPSGLAGCGADDETVDSVPVPAVTTTGAVTTSAESTKAEFQMDAQAETDATQVSQDQQPQDGKQEQEREQNQQQQLRPADEIFLQLLEMVHHSPDRSMLIGSLRCLSAMSASEKNEAAFVETDLAGGRQSPGLLTRCIELLPLTQDQDLQEAVLDLLYQLVCVGNNGLRISSALAPVVDTATGKSVNEATPIGPSSTAIGRITASSSARAFSRTFAFARLLVRNLHVGKTVWEREAKLVLNREWSAMVPSRLREAMRKERELKIRQSTETPEQKARKLRLTSQERQAISGLVEPERGIAWMKTIFRGSATKEVTQMEFWTAYKEEFGQQDVPLQPAAELIRNVSQVFPGASAMVIGATATHQQRFIIRGIEVRERERNEPYRCGWRTCPSRETRTAEAQQAHASTHAKFAKDGRCCWLNCDFEVSDGKDGKDKAELLRLHVLTHLPGSNKTSKDKGTDDQGKAGGKNRTRVVVDDKLRVVEGGEEHGTEPVQFETAVMPNGARFIRGKRDAQGDAVQFRTKTLSPEGGGGTPATPATLLEGVNEAGKSRVKSAVTPAAGTIDNPGSVTFEVARTPSSGADDEPSPHGVAFISLLILRMLTRNAARLLDKAGIRSKDDAADRGGGGAEDVGATLRGEGDEKFGLPLPTNFGSAGSDGQGQGQGQGGGESGGAAGDGASNGAGREGGVGTSDESLGTSEAWAVEAAVRFMDAMLSLEEELVEQSYQNDILCQYINETLVALRRRMPGEKYGFEELLTPGDVIDPDVRMDEASESKV